MADSFKFSEMLQRLQAAKIDMPKEIAENGKDYFRRDFYKQQSPNSVPWNPRKKETAESMGKPILVDTGHLRSDMSDTIMHADWHRIVWGIKPDKVSYAYAKYLNYGTDKMVARPFIADGKEIRGRIKGVIKDSFDKVFGK